MRDNFGNPSLHVLIKFARHETIRGQYLCCGDRNLLLQAMIVIWRDIENS